MKKVLKNPILTFILGAVIFSGISVSAYTLLANNIGYTPSDSSWKKTNGEDITNVKDAIDELYSNTSKISLVWQNMRPNDNFEAQTINVDLSDFNYILIKLKRGNADSENGGGGINPQYSIIRVGESGKIMGIDNNYAFHFIRDVTTTTSSITFSMSYRRGYNLPSADNDLNTAIPLKIYGINSNDIII